MSAVAPETGLPEIVRPRTLDGLPGIQAGFSTRRGGVSAAPYDGLNLGRSTDDAPESVDENRRRFFAAFGAAPEQAAIAGQVHSADVLRVDVGGLYRGVDGLVTRTPGVLLCITAADCASVLLADPVARVVGACHAGWRGAVGGIAEETLSQMAALGADVARVVAYVGPCISPAAFEVGPEVAVHFDAANVRAGAGDRAFVDLPGEIRLRLLRAGVAESAIETDGACTALDPGQRFFSHRASGGRTGRMMGAIVLA